MSTDTLRRLIGEHPHLSVLVLLLSLPFVVGGVWKLARRCLELLGAWLRPQRPLGPSEQTKVALAAHYAVLNEQSDRHLSGFAPGRRRQVRQVLARDWDIKGARAEKRVLARQMLVDLLREGSRSDPQLLAALERRLGDRASATRALLAWDLSRLVLLARMTFFAGYVDEDTAWMFIDTAARELGVCFDDWGEYSNAIFVARTVCTGTEDVQFAGALNELMLRADSPWRTLPWVRDVGTPSASPD